jgi:hypothetical protein
LIPVPSPVKKAPKKERTRHRKENDEHKHKSKENVERKVAAQSQKVQYWELTRNLLAPHPTPSTDTAKTIALITCLHLIVL